MTGDAHTPISPWRVLGLAPVWYLVDRMRQPAGCPAHRPLIMELTVIVAVVLFTLGPAALWVL